MIKNDRIIIIVVTFLGLVSGYDAIIWFLHHKQIAASVMTSSPIFLNVIICLSAIVTLMCINKKQFKYICNLFFGIFLVKVVIELLGQNKYILLPVLILMIVLIFIFSRPKGPGKTECQ
jgi:hypothetical protein